MAKGTTWTMKSVRLSNIGCLFWDVSCDNACFDTNSLGLIIKKSLERVSFDNSNYADDPDMKT